jgi:hypothetical protein
MHPRSQATRKNEQDSTGYDPDRLGPSEGANDEACLARTAIARVSSKSAIVLRRSRSQISVP